MSATWTASNTSRCGCTRPRDTFILVGCKTDLAVGNNRKVTAEQGLFLADYPNIPFMETSVKLGINVEEAFTVISEDIYNKLDRGEYRMEEGWDGIKVGYFQRTDIACREITAKRSDGGSAGAQQLFLVQVGRHVVVRSFIMCFTDITRWDCHDRETSTQGPWTPCEVI